MSEIILFDLDGTLTDSAPGITKSVQYALQDFGVEEPDLDKLKCFVGPPLREQFMKQYHMSQRQAETAVAVYRERYSKTGIYENQLYEGITKILEVLKQENKILAVASSKPELYVRRILEYFNLNQYFDAVVGSNMDGSRTDKAEVIEEALWRLQAQDCRADVLMVGDRSHDVKGALKCGIQCIGAAYGYGGEKELVDAGAAYIARKVDDLMILSERYRRELQRKEQMENAPETVRPKRVRKVRQDDTLTKIWRVLYPIGIHYGAAFFVTQLATIGMYSWYMIKQGGMPIEQLNDKILEQSMLFAGIAGVLALIPLFFFYQNDERLRRSGLLGLRINNRGTMKTGVYVVTILFAITSGHLLNELIAFSGLEQLFPEYVHAEAQSSVLMIAVVGFIAPLAEEFVFRGLVFKRIQDYLGNMWAVVLSALFFGVYHGNVVQFVYATLMGLGFGMIMMRTNSLKVVIVAHMAANLWSMIGSYLVIRLLGQHTLQYFIMLGIFLITALFSGVYLMAGKSKKVQQKEEAVSK